MLALMLATRLRSARRIVFQQLTVLWRSPWLRGGRGLLHAVVAVLAVASLAHAAPAHAATEIRTLIDSDNNPATGCTVATPGGAFGGVEQAAITRIDLLAAEPVGDVAREVCQSGVLVADPSFVPSAPLHWPLGVAAAGMHTDVVESYAQLVSAAASGVRLGFVASTTDGSAPPSALLSADGSGGSPIHLAAAAAAAVAVPALGGAGLLLVACALVFATYRFARVRRYAATGATLCLLLVVSLAWAAIVRDGSPSDWGGTPPVATASTTGPHQIAAVYGRLEGSTLQLRYDLDLGVRDGAPLDDGPFAATVGAPLSVPAPGLLSNDAPGSPPLQVREFRVQGAVSNTPAGGVVAFAGNSLTVAPDGGFTVGPPTLPGTYRFEYRAHNRLTPGGWGVATVEVAAANVCGDGVRTGAEVCDDGNAVTETSCPYGTVSCTTCNATCTATLSLTGQFCGDGARNGAEVCDDGNNVTETSCPDGTATCQACNATCTATLNLTGAFCGDGIRNGAEVCDDGNNVTETSCPYGSASCMACNASCTAPLSLTGGYCGDGVVNGGEVCDGTPGCSAMCTPL
ncbi:hypothetical protein [Acidovorax sp. A79]|uniref:hypothetical protein n=1 Tax=Acidovorax sp. A79 TaxID=3056107 RepID=UPI0034E8DB98